VVATSTTELIAWLRYMNACAPSLRWLRTLPESDGLNGAWRKCERADWMLWLIRHLRLPDKTMLLIAWECADGDIRRRNYADIIRNHTAGLIIGTRK